MKSAHIFALSFLFAVVISCDDDPVGTPTPDQPVPITPDLTSKITSSVSGFVTDENGEPVVYAAITAGDKQTQTDEYGYFTIANASMPKTAAYVSVLKSGYFEGYKTFMPIENGEALVRLELISKSQAGTVDANAGGQVTTAEGATIVLPANGVVSASNNLVYNGQVIVFARSITSFEEGEPNLERPGDSRGVNLDGHLAALKSYSTIAVELTGSNGQPLQLADGKQATLNLPIPNALSGTAPAEIALWSLNTKTGLWEQQGTASKTGNAYVGTVGHFSFWECAEGLPLVNFTARVLNSALQPLVNVPVAINFAGLPKNAGYGRFGYTDTDGYITGAVFANADLVLDIITPCTTSAYSQEFSTGASDLDLGTLTGNLGQNIVTLSGGVKDCENQLVSNGYVQVYDNGFYNRIPVINGAFSFTGLACTNTDVYVVAVDYETYEQNIPLRLEIKAGMNNLDTLVACGTSTMGHITYTLDGGATVEILEPADTVAAFASDEIEGNTWTQVVTMSGDPNGSQQMSFQIKGEKSVIGTHTLTEVFSIAFPSGRGYWPAPVTVNITEYGNVGGFISGTFSSNMLDFESNALHELECSFRVRRRK